MTHSDAVRTLAAERYLLDEMSEIERFAFEDHYFDCVECADEVRTGATLRQAVKSGMLQKDAASRVVPMPIRGNAVLRKWRPAVLVPWAAAATLALAIGYQSVAPARGGRLQVQALTPITVRPDSRGATPSVRIPSDADAVALAIEVDAAGGSELSYELRTLSGDRVAQGRLTAPVAGAPLMLLVPVWTLTPSTQYSLAVRAAADSQLISEYRFVTEGP
jgi:hypothetical protein